MHGLTQTQITRDFFRDLGCGLNERDHERDLGAVAKQRVHSVIFLVHSVLFVFKTTVYTCTVLYVCTTVSRL